jgi:hypothetical protein
MKYYEGALIMNENMKHIATASMEKLTSLENRLSGVLKPIKPRKEFVHGVAHRIQAGTQATFLADRIANWHVIAIFMAGLVSLAVFLAVAGRALISLMGKKRTA